MLFVQLAQTWQAVAATRSRLAKTALLAELLAGLSPTEISVGVAYCCGELPQRQIGVGWAALRNIPDPATQPSLPLSEVDVAFTQIGLTAGPGSQTRRAELLTELFAAMTELEQRFTRQLLTGELRQGALTGVMVEAVAAAGNIPAEQVRRALLLSGNLPKVAVIALTEGSAGLAQFQLQVGQPLAPMLASSAADLSSALSKISPAVIEEKIDGMRVQVHRNQDDITVFTRTLDVITDRVPEIVAAVRELPTQSIVLDGEAVVLHTDQRPQPFQITASRMGSHEVTQTSVSVFFFDLLHADGVDLLDAPAAERFAALTNIVPPYLLIRQITTADLSTAEGFLAETLRRGHEGVMVKSPDMPYAVGRRGASWLKVKPVHTLDLVVLAAEWGHGRRQGWLSNIHLGAYDPNGDFGEPGGFVMLGKTFKGMTDQMLTWQTEYFKKIAQSTVDNYVVRVKPQLVVEVAFDGVQGSTRYPGGVALRFARVKGYRLDKAPESADTITTVRGFLTG